MNRGAEELQKLLSKHGSKIVFATQIGVHDYTVSGWVRGKRKPNTRQRGLIEDQFGIGWRLWDEEVDAEKASNSGPEAA